MNVDTLAGQGTELKGQFKETVGQTIADPRLEQEGAVDQFSGQLRKAFGALEDFARNQPIVAAAIISVGGFLLLNGMRGRSGSR